MQILLKRKIKLSMADATQYSWTYRISVLSKRINFYPDCILFRKEIIWFFLSSLEKFWVFFSFISLDYSCKNRPLKILYEPQTVFFAGGEILFPLIYYKKIIRFLQKVLCSEIFFFKAKNDGWMRTYFFPNNLKISDSGSWD